MSATLNYLWRDVLFRAHKAVRAEVAYTVLGIYRGHVIGVWVGGDATRMTAVVGEDHRGHTTTVGLLAQVEV